MKKAGSSSALVSNISLRRAAWMLDSVMLGVWELVWDCEQAVLVSRFSVLEKRFGTTGAHS
jgi:hypothetical protein